MRGCIGLSSGEFSSGQELSGRTGLYKAGFVGRIASVCVDSDWVTPLRISHRQVRGYSRSTLLCLLRFDELVILNYRFTPAIIAFVFIYTGSGPSFRGAFPWTRSDSRYIRVVTPDDHVNIGFHEVLLHDMEDEDLPFVALSELSCLCLDWPKTLFVFMSRYQHDLERMRKECSERFGCTQSGNCTYCGKYIQQNLGKHIALYHMELAQLWRCPVTWCKVWKGTAQDSIDHLRRTHDAPLVVKAANLARYFPPWTVTREQWSEMTRPTISGVVIDTLFPGRAIPRARVPFKADRICGCLMYVLGLSATLWRCSPCTL